MEEWSEFHLFILDVVSDLPFSLEHQFPPLFFYVCSLTTATPVLSSSIGSLLHSPGFLGHLPHFLSGCSCQRLFDYRSFVFPLGVTNPGPLSPFSPLLVQALVQLVPRGWWFMLDHRYEAKQTLQPHFLNPSLAMGLASGCQAVMTFTSQVWSKEFIPIKLIKKCTQMSTFIRNMTIVAKDFFSAWRNNVLLWVRSAVRSVCEEAQQETQKK